jgi:hypothetical protein
MDRHAPPSRDVRAFLLILAVVLLFSTIVVVVNALFGSVPWLGALPGDITIVVGSMPMRLPVGSCILVAALLTGLAYLISFLLRDIP